MLLGKLLDTQCPFVVKYCKVAKGVFYETGKEQSEYVAENV